MGSSEIEAPRRRRALFAATCILVSAYPFAFIVSMVVRCGYTFLYWDQWTLVPMVGDFFDGRLSFDRLMAQHNEHRVFFPRLAMLCLARLTHWNLAYELVVNLMLGTCVFLTLGYQFHATAKSIGVRFPYAFLPLLSLLAFSFVGWENWLTPWQMAVFVNFLACVLGVVALANLRRPWLGWSIAMLMGVVATFSFGSGMLYWVIVLPILFGLDYPTPKTRVFFVVLWLTVFGVVFAYYLHGFVRIAASTPNGPANVSALDYVEFVLVYLGAAVCNISESNVPLVLVGGAGLILAPVFCMYLLFVRRVHWRILAPYIALGSYGVVSAMVTAFARAAISVHVARSSRYATVAMFFWIAFLGILLIVITDGARTPRCAPYQRSARAATWGLVAGLAVLSLLSNFHQVPAVVSWHGLIANAWSKFVAGDLTDENLRLIYPRPEIVMRYLPILQRHGLSLYRPGGDGGRLASLLGTKEDLLRMGSACIEARSPESGLGCLEAAMDIDPGWAEAHYQIGELLLRERKQADAIPYFVRVTQLEPGGARGHTSLALIADFQGRKDDAVAELRRALECEPNDYTAHFGLGSVLAEQGKLEESLAHLKEAVRIQPRSDDAVRSVDAVQKRLDARRAAAQSADPPAH